MPKVSNYLHGLELTLLDPAGRMTMGACMCHEDG